MDFIDAGMVVVVASQFARFVGEEETGGAMRDYCLKLKVASFVTNWASASVPEGRLD